MKQGMTLDQIGRLLEVHSVKAEVYHAGIAVLRISAISAGNTWVRRIIT